MSKIACLGKQYNFLSSFCHFTSQFKLNERILLNDVKRQ